MIRNYISTLLLCSTFVTVTLRSQEIKLFTTADFDLKGAVKKSLVSTDYGKEEYKFDAKGRLTKSVTRYNEADYTITYYTYGNGRLTEKRFENYRGGNFDKATSIANLYTFDSLQTLKITEKIISYDQDFLDQYQYWHDDSGRLTKIVRTNEEGIDETTVSYTKYRNESTVSYRLNGVLQKSIRTSTRKNKLGGRERIVLTKKFLNGDPHKAQETTFNEKEQVFLKTDFIFDTDAGQFTPERTTNYRYDADGCLSGETVKTGENEEVREYVYQFDDADPKNWVKQIVTPENSYTTRAIDYYPIAETSEEK